MKNLKDCKKLYFLGILGSSMKNLALLCKKRGVSVCGCDINYDGFSSCDGLNVVTEPRPQDFVGIDAVVYSSAIPQDSTPFLLAKNSGAELFSRGEFLHAFSCLFKTVIAISGTHGKTTTTSMIGKAFTDCGKSPAVHIGGDYAISDYEYDYFITEACEYKNNFLTLRPDLSVVLNAEYDHPDCFSSKEDVLRAFSSFASNTKPDGVIFSKENFETQAKLYLTDKVAKAENLTQKNGYFSFTPVLFSKKYDKVSLSVRGEHNVYNALVALLVCKTVGLDLSIVCKSLSEYEGVNRRYQTVNGYGREFILDYAHHPTEIECSIKTAKLTGKKVAVYFQPHTYSRTEALFNDFIKVLSVADELTVVEEFKSRESADMGASAYELFQALQKIRPTRYLEKSELKSALMLEKENPCTVLLLGAGDIDKSLY